MHQTATGTLPLDGTRARNDEARCAQLAEASARMETAVATGTKLTPALMREAMSGTMGGSDAAGAWIWHEAYDAAEAAVASFVRRRADALRKRFPTGKGLLRAVERIAALEPRQKVRSAQQVRLQQFSTPWGIALPAALAAAPPAGTLLLEPSAGTGVLLAAASLAAGGPLSLAANEIDPARRALCARAFPHAAMLAMDAVHLPDRWPAESPPPQTVLMNPPFSRQLRHGGRALGNDWEHVAAALLLLAPGGRLVCVTSDTNGPDTPRVAAILRRHPDGLAVRGSCRIGREVYAPRGTTFQTRLSVIDRTGGPAGVERSGACDAEAATAAELLAWVETHIGPREPARRSPPRPLPAPRHTERREAPKTAAARGKPDRRTRTLPPHQWGPVWLVAHHPGGAPPAPGDGTARPYEPWRPTGIVIDGAPEHPTDLVESTAMAAVPHARASYRPMLTDRVRTGGMLSAAQLESIVLAGEATDKHVGGYWWVSRDGLHASAVPSPDMPPATEGKKEQDEAVEWRTRPVRYRQGWMLGDGTGTGKGRQVAGFLLDQWLRGRRRAVWFSQSDKLIADAERDWVAMGGRASDLLPLRGIRAADPIGIDRGIVFATYATLRQPERGERRSRLDQIVEWLAGGLGEKAETACDAVVVFDESHALSNAARRESDSGLRAKEASMQGRAGLALQRRLPDARVLYVSATGASTVDALAYAERLGLWGFGDTPFRTRENFMSAMEAGDVAALEIVARDLKAMGRYQARALAYTGVEIVPLEHRLTPEQVRIYDAWAEAFLIIHKNLDNALKLTGICATGKGGETVTVDKNAKAAALSNFESTKQRFFSHLLSGMKCPTLLARMERDLAEGLRPVVQLVSTGEALMTRRLATIPASQWNDLEIDLTPREYVLEYLRHAFPTTKHEEVQVGEDPNDTVLKPVTDEDGNPVESAEALRARDEMLSRLASLPGIPTALDQIVHHFGHERVAEITGRSRRILRLAQRDGGWRLAVRRRPDSATLTDGEEFQAGLRDVLVFSGAGNTGRSYHADRSSPAPQRRVHYLLEPGWRADQAIQGLGRTHRTNQASAPMFRPVTSDVAGERRFIATIARRLDSLGAITRGQRTAQTAFTENADQQLFRPEDNLESVYASAALRQLYIAICQGKVDGWSAELLTEQTGLKLQNADGGMLDRLPRIQTFLNRLVALPIEDQNSLFRALEIRVTATVEAARENNTYRTGVETLRADAIEILGEHVAARYDDTDQTTRIVELLRRRRRVRGTAAETIELHRWRLGGQALSRLMLNTQSGHAAHVTGAPARLDDNGGVVRYLRIHRAAGTETMRADNLQHTRWRDAGEQEWSEAWEQDRAAAPQWDEDRWCLATGLLLPCWARLPESSDMRVYRARCDDGRTLIGRVLTPAEARSFEVAMGLEATIAMDLADVKLHLRHDPRGLHLSGGWRLRMTGVHGEERVAVYGPEDTNAAELKGLGLHSEIVNWRTIWFVPDDEALGKLLDAHPLIEKGAREPAAEAASRRTPQ